MQIQTQLSGGTPGWDPESSPPPHGGLVGLMGAASAGVFIDGLSLVLHSGMDVGSHLRLTLEDQGYASPFPNWGLEVTPLIPFLFLHECPACPGQALWPREAGPRKQRSGAGRPFHHQQSRLCTGVLHLTSEKLCIQVGE